jgi:hypothetical protein
MSIAQNFPTISPSLSLDFANVQALDPRITYTRASTATYYGTETAKAEENLLLRSQDYSATWTVTSLTPVTSKTAPDGTSTATEFTASAANAVLTQGYTAVAGSYTFSVFLRRVTGSGDIQIAADNGTWTTKVITGTWARYDVTQTVAAGSKTAGVRVVTDTDAIEVWGAQLEQRSTVTAYTPTTTQPITNYIPVLETALSGVARFDHNPTTFESLGLLIEQQSTNLVTYSEQFDDASWTKEDSVITANTIIAPDGTLTGDKLVANTVNTAHTARKNPTLADNTSYTWSFYAKAGEYSWVSILTVNKANTSGISFVDLTTGATGTVAAAHTISVTSVGNGWYRVSCVFGSGSGATTPNVRIETATANNTRQFAGNGFSGIYIWGAQLEAVAFPTSYIPTVASQVTRAADSASMTGTNFTSFYNQAEGSFYGEATPNALTSDSRYIHVGDAATNRMIFFGSSATFFVQTRTAGVDVASLSFSGLAANTTFKFANTYKVNDFAATVNASTVQTDTAGAVPTASQMIIGSSASSSAFLNGTIKKLAYYPKRLTNAQLQAITG